MVTLTNPYTGGVVTVSVSRVGQLQRQGWGLVGPLPDVVVAVPLGQVTEPADKAVEQASDMPKRGASRPVWRDYAEALGINTEGLKRHEIQDAVREAQSG